MIRDAEPSDREAVVPLWADCLALHGAPFDRAAFGRTWDRALAGQNYGLRLTGPPGAPLGFALHGWGWNSWAGAEEGSLDTLYVAPRARGQGLAQALLDDLLTLARLRGWRSVVWHVAPGNGPARALYDRYTRPDGYIRYRAIP